MNEWSTGVFVEQPLASPGSANLVYTASSLIHWLIQWVREPFPPTALRLRHAQTVRDRCSSYKTDYVIVIKNFLNPEGHQHPISGSKVMDILLKGWILPIGGASAGLFWNPSLTFFKRQWWRSEAEGLVQNRCHIKEFFNSKIRIIQLPFFTKLSKRFVIFFFFFISYCINIELYLIWYKCFICTISAR